MSFTETLAVVLPLLAISLSIIPAPKWVGWTSLGLAILVVFLAWAKRRVARPEVPTGNCRDVVTALIHEGERLRTELPEVTGRRGLDRDTALVKAKLYHERPILSWRENVLAAMDGECSTYSGFVSRVEPQKPVAVFFGKYLDDRIADLRRVLDHL